MFEIIMRYCNYKVGAIKLHVIICLLGIIHFGVWDSLGQQGKNSNPFLYHRKILLEFEHIHYFC